MNTTVWQIVPDSDRYRSLAQADSPEGYLGFLEAFKSGKPISDLWQPVTVHLYASEEEEKTKPLGDFPSLYAGVPPVFSNRALAILKTLIKDSIEVLPLKGMQGNFSVVNVTDVIDCLDHQRSRYVKFKDSDRIMYIEHYVFREDCLSNKHIFRIPETIASAVFVSDAFKNLVEENSLEGLVFTEID